MGTSGILGRLAVAGAVAVALGAVASTADAATLTHAQIRSARHAFVRSLPSSLMSAVRPHLSGAVPDGSYLELFTPPTALPAINGKAYQMQLDAYTFTNSFGAAPEFDTSLFRLATSHGQVTGEQAHIYAYTSTDVLMSADQGLTNFRLNTRDAFRPTRVNIGFTPTESRSANCTLFGGGHGTLTVAQGTLSKKAFLIHTGTSPFFGNIKTLPKTAIGFTDPGCSGAVELGASTRTVSSSRPQFYFPCSGRETLQAGGPFGQTLWQADVGFGGRHAYLYNQTSTSSTTAALTHFAVGVESSAGMPMPKHSGSGATAILSAQGNSEFGGSAMFFSRHVPRTSSVQSCVYEGHVHRFVATRYSGGMAPVAGNPLAALFDTGALNYHGQAASLTIRRFLS
ncbi:MAG: hypothetical protein ACTHNU_12530 [Gaiellales bacterium]